MQVVDRVLTHHSFSTLFLSSMILATTVTYETLLVYARRLIILVIGVRTDAKLSLHVFNRLIRLPLDYFERHPAGETMYKVSQVNKVREFMTGKLMTTLLDMITPQVVRCRSFWLNAPLAWPRRFCHDHADYFRPSARSAGLAKVVHAEVRRTPLGETIRHQTVKSLTGAAA